MNTITKKPSSDKELLTRLAVLVDPMKTPKPMQKEIEEVWNICRKITGIIDWLIEYLDTTMLVFVLSSIIYLIRKTTILCHDVEKLKKEWLY